MSIMIMLTKKSFGVKYSDIFLSFMFYFMLSIFENQEEVFWDHKVIGMMFVLQGGFQKL